VSPSPEGLVQSLQARLLNHARSVGADPNTVLARYGLERFLAYRPETAIAEKLHAMSVLGMANTRMRDIFDLYELSRRHEFDGAALATAVHETFARRRTEMGPDLPAALTAAFGEDHGKQVQWSAFIRKGRLVVPDLPTTTTTVAAFVQPILAAARSGVSFTLHWPAGGDWRDPHK
jgi:hypothetical protein